MSVTVGVPGPADAAALAALMADTFTETYAPDNDPNQIAAHVANAFDPATVAERLADPRRSTLWLLDAGAPVGYLMLNTGAAQTVDGLADGLEVEQVYVRSSHHGQGLGALLLDRAVQTARELGLGFVWLGVWEHNERAIAVYEHLGFRAFDEHVFVLNTEEQRDLLLRRDLWAGHRGVPRVGLWCIGATFGLLPAFFGPPAVACPLIGLCRGMFLAASCSPVIRDPAAARGTRWDNLFRVHGPPDDDREVIEAVDRRGEPAMSHIAPVMLALVEAGNRVSVRNQNFGFIPQPHGWSAYLDEPIDFDLIERRFVLPPTIHLDRANDQILDDHAQAYVYGGDAQRRLRAANQPR